MASCWACCMVVEKIKLYSNLMCFELPRKLNVESLQIQALPCLPELIVRAVGTATARACYYYSLGKRSAHNLVHSKS